MQSQELSPNVAHAGSVQTLAAAIELGTEAMMHIMGGDEVSNTLNGQSFKESDVRAALAARISKKIGV